MNAITSVATAADTHVANSTSRDGMPVVDRIWGLTAMMYAIAMKVVTPATTSTRTETPAASAPSHLRSLRIMAGLYPGAGMGSEAALKGTSAR